MHSVYNHRYVPIVRIYILPIHEYNMIHYNLVSFCESIDIVVVLCEHIIHHFA